MTPELPRGNELATRIAPTAVPSGNAGYKTDTLHTNLLLEQQPTLDCQQDAVARC